jgi:hypothetical protein
MWILIRIHHDFKLRAPRLKLMLLERTNDAPEAFPVWMRSARDVVCSATAVCKVYPSQTLESPDQRGGERVFPLVLQVRNT